jgi:hypothetical protein
MREEISNVHQEEKEDTDPQHSPVADIANNAAGEKSADQTADHNNAGCQTGCSRRSTEIFCQIASANDENRVVANHAQHVDERDGDECTRKNRAQSALWSLRSHIKNRINITIRPYYSSRKNLEFEKTFYFLSRSS